MILLFFSSNDSNALDKISKKEIDDIQINHAVRKPYFDLIRSKELNHSGFVKKAEAQKQMSRAALATSGAKNGRTRKYPIPTKFGGEKTL